MQGRALRAVANLVTVAVSHSRYDLGQVILPSWAFPFLSFKAAASKIPRARTPTAGDRRMIAECTRASAEVALTPAGPTALKCST